MTLPHNIELVRVWRKVIFGPDIVTEAEEKVKQIQANILAAQSC
jgi:hypothetical protein